MTPGRAPPLPPPPRPTTTTTTKPTTTTTSRLDLDHEADLDDEHVDHRADDHDDADRASAGGAVTMDPLPGMPDRGTATVTVSGSGDKRTMEVELKGMPAPGGGTGVYELWLYNTLIGAQSLGTADCGRRQDHGAPCPLTRATSDYLDLSRESGPSDHIHSGISIRRAALAPLLAAAAAPPLGGKPRNRWKNAGNRCPTPPQNPKSRWS